MLLSNLPLKSRGKITDLTAEGKQRRRLLDLGLIPGTMIVSKIKSPSGDPTAYLIRGTILALRKEESNLIKVSV